MGRPRIRSLKPEIWQSADFMALSPVGRLAFIALITLADDDGRLKMTAAHLVATTLHDAEPGELSRQLALMERLDMIACYQVDGRDYIALINWRHHQRVDHPSVSRFPAPPEVLARAREVSGASARASDPLGSDLGPVFDPGKGVTRGNPRRQTLSQAGAALGVAMDLEANRLMEVSS